MGKTTKYLLRITLGYLHRIPAQLATFLHSSSTIRHGDIKYPPIDVKISGVHFIVGVHTCPSSVLWLATQKPEQKVNTDDRRSVVDG